MAVEPIRILFVCTGNICRSPLAEGIFRHLVKQANVEDRFEIDSAGTSGYHAGDPPDARSASTARGRGIELNGASRQIKARDLKTFDYIVVMDEDNFSSVQALASRSGETPRVHLLREWDPENRRASVPDPYYGGSNGFEDVHDIVERSCINLLDDLLDSPEAE